MGWNTANVHRLAGFEAAKVWHDRTKPIRGNKHNIRPLGSRRHHHMADIHMPDDNTVQLRYWGQTLVEWHSDNTYSVFPPKYYSAFTPDNIHNFLPSSGQGFKWDRGRMFYADAKEVFELPRQGGRLDFQFVDGRSFLLNAPVAYNIRAKRGKLKQVMSRYDAFLSWAQVVLAVTDTFSTEETDPSFDRFSSSLGYLTAMQYQKIWNNKEMSQEERDEMWEERYAREALPFGYGYNDWRRGAGFNAPACERVREMLVGGNPEDWVDVLHISASQAGKWVWAQPSGRRFSADACIDWFKKLVTYLHRDEMFDRVRLPKGAMPSRTNTRYFRESNFVPRKLRQSVEKSNQV